MFDRNAKAACVVLLAGGFSLPAFGDNAWGNYHWARTTTPFDLTVVNSTTSDWDYYVGPATDAWSWSSVLSMVEEAGATSSKVRRKCKPPNGQVRICNLAYGQNGWLGLAGVSIDTNDHIVSGYTKLNDSYFNWAYYDNAVWKQSVACQELGHNIGLGRQDTVFGNESLYSCMDYQDPPYEYPMLTTIPSSRRFTGTRIPTTLIPVAAGRTTVVVHTVVAMRPRAKAATGRASAPTMATTATSAGACRSDAAAIPKHSCASIRMARDTSHTSCGSTTTCGSTTKPSATTRCSIYA